MKWTETECGVKIVMENSLCSVIYTRIIPLPSLSTEIVIEQEQKLLVS